MRLCCFRASEQVMVIVLGKAFARSMNFSHNRVVPVCGSSH